MSSKQLITPLSPEKKPGAGLRKAFAVKQEGIIPAQKKRPDFWSLGKKKTAPRHLPCNYSAMFGDVQSFSVQGLPDLTGSG